MSIFTSSAGRETIRALDRVGVWGESGKVTNLEHARGTANLVNVLHHVLAGVA